MQMRNLLASFGDEAHDLSSSINLSSDFAEPSRFEADSLVNQAEAILLLDYGPQKTGELNGTSLAELLYSLAKSKVTWLNFHDLTKILILDSIYNHYSTMTAKDVTNTLWALAKLGCVKDNTKLYFLDNETIDCLVQTTYRTADQYQSRTCTRILWSFAALNLSYEGFSAALPVIIETVFNDWIQDTSLTKYNDKQISQLTDFISYYQNNLISQFGKKILSLSRLLTERTNQMQTPKSSKFHKDVEAWLEANCLNEFKSEYPIAGSNVDICFPTDKIIFQVNGPKHYNSHNKLTSATMHRDRILSHCGYQVFHICYLEWQRAKEAGKTDELMIDLVNKAGLNIRKREEAITFTNYISADNPPPAQVVNFNFNFFIQMPEMQKPEDKRTKRKRDDSSEPEDNTVKWYRIERNNQPSNEQTPIQKRSHW